MRRVRLGLRSATRRNGEAQIYLRDTEANTTTLVSVADGGGGGDGTSRSPVISPDCRYVAWDSEATDLLPMPRASGSSIAATSRAARR